MRIILNIAIILLLSSPAFIRADEVTDTLDKARSAYNEKQYTDSVTELNKAISGIQKLISQQVMQCLPGTMEGWERTEPSSTLDSQPVFGLVSSNVYSVEVRYSKKEPAQQVAITISNIPHIVQIAKAGIQLLSNPFFSKMQQENKPEEKIETYKLGNFEGAKNINTQLKMIEVTLFYGDLMVQLRGTEMADFSALEKFVQGVKYDDLKKFSIAKEEPAAPEAPVQAPAPSPEPASK